MIVKIGGWLYVVSGVIGLLPALGVRGSALPESIYSSLIFAAFSLAVGIGLLRLLNWARWLALGVSLMTWTLGSLGVLVALTYALRALFSGGGLFIVLALAMLIAGGIFAVIIVINYKLFFYLLTQDARDEFVTPDSEYRPVLKSTGLYIAMVCFLGVVESTTSGWKLESGSMQRASRAKAAEEARARELDATRERANRLAIGQQAENQIALQRQLAALQAQQERSRIALEKAQLERERGEQADEYRSTPSDLAVQRRNASPGRVTSSIAPSRAYATEARRPGEKQTSGPDDASPAESGGGSATSKILKCRDASGSVQFTQGYCPSGTTRVDMPPSE